MPEEVWDLSRIRTYHELSRIESFEDRYDTYVSIRIQEIRPSVSNGI